MAIIQQDSMAINLATAENLQYLFPESYNDWRRSIIMEVNYWGVIWIIICQCKIRLPTQVYMFSIRRSRLLNTLVCIVYVSM